jgi:hypothetical protein
MGLLSGFFKYKALKKGFDLVKKNVAPKAKKKVRR